MAETIAACTLLAEKNVTWRRTVEELIVHLVIRIIHYTSVECMRRETDKDHLAILSGQKFPYAAELQCCWSVRWLSKLSRDFFIKVASC